MSGIAGLVALDGSPVDEDTSRRLIETLAHRGPDGCFAWSEGSVGLARASFHTTPTSRFTPGIHDDGEILVVADMRLDERVALASKLDLAPRQVSDSALLSAAYRRWGESCPAYLTGDFAFALWDRRARLLFCARDHFGVRPFFYMFSRGRFAFGSEIKALIESGVTDFELREAAIGEYLSAAPADPEATFYANIFSLRPGHSISLHGNELRKTQYWKLEPGRVSPSQDPVEEFIALFDQAVSRRTDSARPLGALLSGGLDSSSIVRSAAASSTRETGQLLPTISAVFDQTPQWSERPYIESVLQKGGCDPEIVSIDDYAPFADLNITLAEQDGPFFAPGMALTRRIYSVANQRGLAVLLDGHGGDETVSHGYGRLEDLAKARDWPQLWNQVRGVGNIYGESHHAAFIHYFLKHGPLRRPTLATRRMLRALRRESDVQRPSWAEFINPDFVARLNLAERRADLTPPRPYGEQARHLADLLTTNTAVAFEGLDRQAAARGIEVRYPFWDRALVEFCLNLPSEEKLNGGWTRLILRRAMEGRLPSDVQWRRTKLDFGPHLIRGMIDRHASLIEAVLFEDSGQIAQYLDLNALGEAYRRMKAMREEALPADAFGIYRAVVFSEWNRKHFPRF